ncbi:MAG: proprotein convertase P-domain-containing protein [Novosphingobium sp.]
MPAYDGRMTGRRFGHIGRMSRLLLAITMAFFGLWFPQAALAQSVQYTNATSGAINDVTCGTGGIVSRTFSVGTSYTVGDVNLGVLLSHTYRSDLRITLRSPAGTTVNVMLNTGGSGDNLNDLFDDQAASAISTHSGTVTDPLTPAPPPYSHTFQPSAALSAFNGQNAQGTWTMEICDSVAGDVGTFTQADLFITPAADLSLAQTVSNAAPNNGSTISYTLTVANSAVTNGTATGITVGDSLPAGVSFVSATGAGSYNSSTGVWTVGTLAPGASASITITVTVTAASGTVTNVAQITASSLPDPDSTPNNGVSTEDDYASAAFTVSAVLPAPTCPAGGTRQNILNGDFSSGVGPSWPNWTAGAVWYGSGSAAAQNDTVSGSLSQSGLSGLNFGPSAGNGAVIELSVWWRNANPATGSLASTLTVSVAGTPYARITTDSSAGTIANIAYLNGASGNLATLTEFATTGWRINVPTSVAATGALTFDFVPVGIASDDFMVDNVTLYTCAPGSLTTAKSSRVVSDPINNTSNPKAIPGAVVEYCVLTTNPGPATASSVVATDVLPASVTYIAGSMTSSTGCSPTAGTAEDDDATGADESDPWGMSISGTTITGVAPSLASSATFAMRYRVTVK